MGRYTGPVCRLCRRAGEKLFLKGERCFTPKCAVERRRKPPGDVHFRRPRVSDWGTQLREKQKARHAYGVLETQFRKYFQRAQHSPGTTGETLLQLLERRLDNVVFRLDFAESRSQARQLVRHGHIKVGGKKVSIPSFQVKEDDTVEWRETTQSRDFFKSLSEASPRKTVPAWLALDPAKMSGRVLHLPLADEMDIILDTRMIVEFYSK